MSWYLTSAMCRKIMQTQQNVAPRY